MDLIKVKKETLMPHVGFVQQMLTKMKGNEEEAKWQAMYNCIVSDKKK